MRAYKPHPTLQYAQVDVDGRVLWLPTPRIDGFQIGTDRPMPDNVGCITPHDQMRVEPEMVTITTDDAVVERVWFKKGVTVRANRVRLEDCFINQNTAGASGTKTTKNPEGNHVGIDTNHVGYHDTVVERCSVVPNDPEVLCYGVIGSYTTTIGCYFAEGWTDDVNWQSNGSVSGACHSIGDYFSPEVYDSDPDQNGGRSHSDCIQVANGWGHTVLGSHMAAVPGDAYSHGMVIGPYAAGGIGGISVKSSWFSGGGAQFSAWANGSTDKVPTIPGLTLIGNRHDAAGCLNDLQGGVYCPQTILLNPETWMASRERIVNNVQINPCTPATGTPYGSGSTPTNPVPAFIYVAKLNW